MAIDTISQEILDGTKNQVLLGVTGSGKTFTMANIIARVNRPALILAPNKTLAAQLYNEFRHLFPKMPSNILSATTTIISPKPTSPPRDTYIQKDSSINEMIDKMRHSATRNVLSRTDVVVVASVSCIFRPGCTGRLPLHAHRHHGRHGSAPGTAALLVGVHPLPTQRYGFPPWRFSGAGGPGGNFSGLRRGHGRAHRFFRGRDRGYLEFDPLKGTTLRRLDKVTLFPASHYVTRKATLERATKTIVRELKERVDFFRDENKLIEAQRIEERTLFDLEMIQEIGYCNGIENYSRHLTGRQAGQPPPTLLDYFPEDFLVFIDESHIAVPQIRAMYKGDRSRKTTLVTMASGCRRPWTTAR